jgi:hypothetical protein
MNRMTESQLRAALRTHLARGLLSGSGRIVEELGVERGAARIDVAVITDRLLGYEIKSDRDTFDRLSNQIHAYNRVFDEITLVTGSSLLDDALRLLPSWWGVMAVENHSAGVAELRIVRPARENPAQDALSVAMMLWKTEAIDMLAIHVGRDIPSRWARSRVHALLAEAVPLESLRRLVAKTLTAREN